MIVVISGLGLELAVTAGLGLFAFVGADGAVLAIGLGFVVAGTSVLVVGLGFGLGLTEGVIVVISGLGLALWLAYDVAWTERLVIGVTPAGLTLFPQADMDRQMTIKISGKSTFLNRIITPFLVEI
ncbi:hypothetical protein EHS13_23940 [Paenibacillus psychroresistens]|uniref:Uncharacterized protein n=1 Tax=Paenibacillus psychroresistens TaxID=1778678 RepID=A0A6B8RPV1_9BACL|nr:hypothetical protein EHS13_23940 [Paenibacillus psychroresistens]